MILVSVIRSEGSRLGIKLPSGIVVLSDVCKEFAAPDLQSVKTIDGVLSNPEELVNVARYLNEIMGSKRLEEVILPEKEVQVGLPFKPRSILCVGRNYLEHAKEGGVKVPDRPMLFAKLQNCLVGPDEPILLPLDSFEVDYEAELAVVIGRRCHRVTAEEALSYVAGYTCMNDVSARDFQRSDGQWLRAKSQDTFGPFGPYVVTRDEIPDPQTLSIRCWLNEQLVQDSNTREMVFSVRELIAFISRGLTLLPGDVISTGTPPGVGGARKPPLYLKDGDTVAVEIERIGRLCNPVMKATDIVFKNKGPH